MTARPHDEESIFASAIDIKSAKEREEFVESACSGNENLHDRLKALLKSHDEEKQFLKPPERPIPAPPIVTEKPGTVIGPYKLRENIGEGGFGVVYVAEQEKPVRRKVALKIIKAGMDTKDVVARFEAERQALALMDHPNVARVLDAGATKAGRPYFVMELVNGVAITDFCDKNNLTTVQRLELFVDICHAVQHAHSKGIIHRDLKPSNVMVTLHDGKPVPKVIDFGVSKALSQQLTEKTVYTQYGQMIGTPVYMSPEQAEMSGLGIDTRSDVYSLGVLLYELLTGLPPIDAARLRKSGYAEMVKIIRDEEPPLPSMKISTLGKESAYVCKHRQTDARKLSQSLRGELDWIVMKALEKDRERRYETANGFANDIRRFLNDEPVTARPASFGYRLKKLIRRNKVRAGVIGFVSLALIVAVFGVTFGLIRTLDAKNDVEQALAEKDDALTREMETSAELKRVAAAHLEGRVRANLSHGNTRLNAGDPIGALPWFAEALKLQQDDPARRAAHRLRLKLAMQSAPELIRTFLPAGNIESAALNADGSRLAILLKPEGEDNVRTRPQSLMNARRGGTLQREELEDDSEPPETPILIYATSNGRLVGRWTETGRVIRMAFSPSPDQANHLLIALGSPDNRRAVIRDVAQDRLLFEFQHMGLQDALFSPDGSKIVTLGGTRARVWNALTGKQTSDLDHAHPVTVAVFGPQGKRLVTAGRGNGTPVQFWEIPSGKLLRKTDTGGGVQKLAISPDGSRVLVAGWSRSQLLTGDGTEVGSAYGRITNVRFDSSGRRYAIGGRRGAVRIRVSATGRLQGTIPASGDVAPEFSRDGRWIACADARQAVRIYSVRFGKLLGCPLPATGQFREIHWGHDNQLLYTVADNGIRLWRLPGTVRDQGAGQNAIYSDRRQIWCASASRDGKLIAVAGQGAKIGIYDAQTLKKIKDVNVPVSTPQVEFLGDGARIVTASLRGKIRVYDWNSGRPVGREMDHDSRIGLTDLFPSPDGRRVITLGMDRRAVLWDVKTSTRIRSFDRVTSAVFRDNGRRILTQSSDGSTAVVWEIGKADPVATLPHADRLTAADLDTSGRIAATGGADGRVRIWNVDSGRIRKVIPLKSGRSPLAVLQFSPDGKRLLTGTSSGKLRIWNRETGKPLTSVFRTAGRLSSAKFDPHGKLAEFDPHGKLIVSRSEVSVSPDKEGDVSSTRNKTVELWSAGTGRLVSRVATAQPVKDVRFSPNGAFLFTEQDARVDVVRLTDDATSSSRLMKSALLLAARRVDSTGSIVPFSGRELKQLARDVALPDGLPDSPASSRKHRLVMEAERALRRRDAETALKKYDAAYNQVSPSEQAEILRGKGRCWVVIAARDARAGRYAEAAVAYRMAIQESDVLRTEFPDSLINRDRRSLAVRYLLMGRALVLAGAAEAGIEAGRRSVRLYTTSSQSGSDPIRVRRTKLRYRQSNVVRLLLSARRYDLLETELGELINAWSRLMVEDTVPMDRLNLGLCRMQLAELLDARGDRERAGILWRQAVDNFVTARLERTRQAGGLGHRAIFNNNVAWMLVAGIDPSSRNPERAVGIVRKAINNLQQGSRRGGRLLRHVRNTLACANYRAGDYQSAVRILEALTGSVSDNDPFRSAPTSGNEPTMRMIGTSGNWLLLAMARHKTGDKDKARQAYDRAVRRIERFQVRGFGPETVRLRAEAAVLLGINDGGSDTAYRVARGRAAAELGKPQEAIAELSAVLKQHPKSLAARVARAEVYLSQQAWDKAAADYNEAIRLSPDDAVLRRDRGFALAQADITEIVPAGSQWKWKRPPTGYKADETPPDLKGFAGLKFDDSGWNIDHDRTGRYGGFETISRARHATGEVVLGTRYSSRRPVYFRHAFETSKAYDRLTLRLQYADGIVVYLDGKEVGRAGMPNGPDTPALTAVHPSFKFGKRLRTVVLQGPLPPGKHILAICVHHQPNFSTSSLLRIGEISLYGRQTGFKAPELKDPELLADRGLAYATVGRKKEAARDLEAIGKRTATTWPLNLALARLAVRGGRLAEALPGFTSAVTARPNDVELLRDRADLAAALGRWEIAAADMRKLVKLRPYDDWLMYQCLPLQMLKGDRKQYDELSRLGYQRFSKHKAYIGERIAKASLLVNDYKVSIDEARRMADRALASASQPFCWFDMAKGLVEYRAGNYDLALTWLERARTRGGADRARTCAAMSHLVTALVHAHEKEAKPARRHLDSADAILKENAAATHAKTLAGYGHDEQICELLRRELMPLLSALNK